MQLSGRISGVVFSLIGILAAAFGDASAEMPDVGAAALGACSIETETTSQSHP